MKLAVALCLIALALALTLEARAATEVITFDDLPTPLPESPVPNGYGSLNWQGFDYVNASGNFLNTLNGLVSGTNVATDMLYDPIIYAATTPTFNVNSVYVTTTLSEAPFNVEIVGYRSGTVIYDKTFAVNSSGPTLLSLNYLNVKSIQFIAPFIGYPFFTPGRFVIDNLSVTVPEPALSAFAAFAALALALIRSRPDHAPA